MENYIAPRALFTDVDPNNPNAKGGRILEFGDEAATHLLVAKGCELDAKTAARFGLPGSAEVKPEDGDDGELPDTPLTDDEYQAHVRAAIGDELAQALFDSGITTAGAFNGLKWRDLIKVAGITPAIGKVLRDSFKASETP